MNNDKYQDAIFYPFDLDSDDLDEFKEIFDTYKDHAINKLTYAQHYGKCNFDKKKNIEKSLLINNSNNESNNDGSDDEISSFIIIDNNEFNKISSKILAVVIMNDLGAIIKTTASYFVAYDFEMNNGYTIVWSKNNFTNIKKKILKWIDGKNKIMIHYVRPNRLVDGYNGKNVFFMVSDNYYAAATNNKCLIS